MTKRKDYSGETFGPVTVLRRLERHWLIHWSCCDREQEITPERMHFLRVDAPKRCRKCATAGAEPDSEKARQRREARAAKEETPRFIDVRGFRFFYLEPLGPRNGIVKRGGD